MASNTVRLSCSALSLFVLLLAVYYKQNYDDELQNRLQSTLSGLLIVEQKASEALPKKRVAVGFGVCLDLLVDSSLIFATEPPEQALHHGFIATEQEFKQVYAYFFDHGAAGERYVNNFTLFSELVAQASALKHARWALGGNAPVMASRFFEEGADVFLGAQLTEKALQMMPKGIKHSQKNIKHDDVHLIFEYKTKNSWGTFSAPRDNRFIVHSDKENPLVTSVEDFQKNLKTFKPDLVVVSGLQMMDNFPFKKGQRLARVEAIKNMLKETERSSKVHFEMASFSDEPLFFDLMNHIIPYSSSLGMNEQELPNIRSALMYGNLSLISPSHPRIASVLDQMRDVFRILSQTNEVDGKRRLTRLHVHTLAYQAIMTKKNSEWKNTMLATAKASLTANRHVCGSDQVDTSKAKLIMDDSFATSVDKTQAVRINYDTNQPVSCWTEDDVEICVAPVLVCTDVRQTAGCGDNISSGAILPQV